MKSSNLFRPTKFKRALFFLISDIFISLFTLFLAYLLRFNFAIPDEYLSNFFNVAFILISAKVFFLYIFKFSF